LLLLFTTTNANWHPEGVDTNCGTPRHALYSERDDETKLILMMRKNLCHYAQIVDTYAPCIVGCGTWNSDVNMETQHGATTDRKVWSKNILSISDEAFMSLCLFNYWQRWFAEVVKSEKMVRHTLFVFITAATTFRRTTTKCLVMPTNKQKNKTWTDEDNKNVPVSTPQTKS
jgi:hypothetical protein